MSVPADLLYVETHEWCRVADGVATVGVTDFAQDQLGDVVYLELPAVGTRIADRSRPFGTIESVKAASDLFSPVTGEVVAVNTALEHQPEQVNQDPYGAGWIIQVRLADPAELDGLLDAAAYAQLIAQ
ncbi:MAG: glycine cleavage system protein GcvH [Armatimonadetes bacterium]|nr:glycine cleavage system protein GcvH [Armatimonadota bacterium]